MVKGTGSLGRHQANNPEMDGWFLQPFLTQNSGKEPLNILLIYIFTQRAYSTYYDIEQIILKPQEEK